VTELDFSLNFRSVLLWCWACLLYSAYSKSLSYRSDIKQDFQSESKEELERRKIVDLRQGANSSPVVSIFDKRIYSKVFRFLISSEVQLFAQLSLRRLVLWWDWKGRSIYLVEFDRSRDHILNVWLAYDSGLVRSDRSAFGGWLRR